MYIIFIFVYNLYNVLVSSRNGSCIKQKDEFTSTHPIAMVNTLGTTAMLPCHLWYLHKTYFF